jgi:hypothetical protein
MPLPLQPKHAIDCAYPKRGNYGYGRTGELWRGKKKRTMHGELLPTKLSE